MSQRSVVLSAANSQRDAMSSNRRNKDMASQKTAVRGKTRSESSADSVLNDSNGSNAENDSQLFQPETPSKRIKLSSAALLSSSKANDMSKMTKRLKRNAADIQKNCKRLSDATNSMNSLQQRKLGGNGSGIIKSIKLYNFMCHTSFYQEWHENLNFITGENGSGKSALLSGIMIGLGGKAISTSRTSSVKDLIKTGATHAKTEIVLINKGKLPEETYGNEVAIQRIINTNGTSMYKMKTSKDSSFKPITRQKLTNILQLLDINLENPVVVLNQEYARSFLRSKDPKDKYKLFEDGTGTADCDRMRLHVQETLTEITETVNEKEKEVAALKKIYDDCKDKVKIIEGIGKHQDLLGKLKCELKWYFVKVEEDKEKYVTQEVAAEVAKLEKFKINREKSKKALEDFENDTTPSAEVREERLKRKRVLQEAREGVMKQMSYLTKTKVGLEMRSKAAKLALQEKQKQLARLELKLRKADEEDKEKHSRLLEEFQAEKENLQERIRALEPTLLNLQSERKIFSEGLEQKRAEMASKRREADQLRDQIQIKKRQLTQLESAQPSYAGYGPSMEALMAKLKTREKDFKKLPKGPLGSLITIKDPKYLDLVQHVLGRKLKDFVVDNQEDFFALDRLIKEAFRGSNQFKPDVHVIRFSPGYDVSETNVSRGTPYQSILDAIEFDNNDGMVKNAFIEISGIEKILLFKDSDEAIGFLKHREQVPRGCRYGYSLDYYQIFPDPHLRCNAMRPPSKNAVKLIKASKRLQKRMLQMEVLTLQEELKNFTFDDNSATDEQLRQQIQKKDEEYRTIRANKLSLEQKLQNMKPPVNQLIDMESLREELEDTKSDIEAKNTEIGSMDAELSQTELAMQEKHAEKNSIDIEIEAMDKQKREEEERVEHSQRRRQELKGFVERFEKAVNSATEALNDAKGRLVVAKQKVTDATAEAAELGERVNSRRGSAEIKKEYDSVAAKVEYLMKFKEKHAAIQERFKVVGKRYKKFCEDLEFIEDMKEKVFQYFLTVNAHYLNARDRIVEVLMECYRSIAASRKYHGKLVVDHDAKELYYLVCPDKDSLDKVIQSKDGDAQSYNKKKMVEYAAGLSGGERSFSTLCFIIAMWQAMKTPFYMLDEFDVFMDAQNRAVSQEALMGHARQFANNQFFFFTPLDLTALPSEQDALILRLYPPNRASDGLEDNEMPSGSQAQSQAPRRRRRLP